MGYDQRSLRDSSLKEHKRVLTHLVVVSELTRMLT